MLKELQHHRQNKNNEEAGRDKFCSSSGKLLQCSSQDGIDSISFVVSRASTETSSEAGICSVAAIFFGCWDWFRRWDFFGG
jgi:hypothetical protein